MKKLKVEINTPKGKRIPGQIGQVLKIMLLFLPSK